MNEITGIVWSSDGKTPYDQCIDDIHVFRILPVEGIMIYDPAETVCQCQKTVWRFIKCEHCGESRGKAREIKHSPTQSP